MGRLEHLRQLAIASNLESFMAEHGHPVLVPTGVLAGDVTPTGSRRQNATVAYEDTDSLDVVLLRLSRTHTLSADEERHGGRGGLLIGRDAACDVTIVDYTISKNHARLEPGTSIQPARLFDLDSRNGTWVDDQRVTPDAPAEVACGALVRLGRMVFTYLSARGLYAYLRPDE